MQACECSCTAGWIRKDDCDDVDEEEDARRAAESQTFSCAFLLSFSFHTFCVQGKPVNVRVQQDASEFLSVCLDRVEHGCPPYSKEITTIFTGGFVNQVREKAYMRSRMQLLSILLCMFFLSVCCRLDFSFHFFACLSQSHNSASPLYFLVCRMNFSIFSSSIA